MVPAVVTGKPLTIGGSLGREEATARGSLFCIRDAVAKQDRSLAGMTAAVQGFGNVGSFLAKFLHEEGAKVIAISDSIYRPLQPEGHRRADRVRVQARAPHAGRPEGRRGDHERGAAAARLRHPRPVRARAGHERAQRRPRQGGDHLRGRERPGHPGRGCDPRGQRRPDPAGRARECRRRRRLVLRVGPGPPGQLLGGQAESPREPNDIGQLRVLRERAASPSGAQRADAGRRVRPRRAARRRGDRLPGASTRRPNELGRSGRLRRRPGRPFSPPCRRSSSTTRRTATCANGRLRRCASCRRSSGSSCGRSTSAATPSSRLEYREWIPVVEVDGRRRFTYFVQPEALRKAVAQADA